MKRMRFRIAALRFSLVLSVLMTILVSQAHADIPIVSDSYATGTDPTMGQYVVSNPLSNQPGLVTPGFNTGGYTSGTGTSNFLSTASGLNYAADGADSTTGAVAWVGSTGAEKSVARNLTPYNEGSSGTFWISELMKNTGNQTTTTGWLLSGFGNSTAPTLGTTTPGFLTGIFFGFADDTGAANRADLVMRYRDTSGNNGGKSSADTILVDGTNNATAGQTYLVVAAVNLNYSGSLDKVTYWVNPTDLSSQTALTNTALTTGSVDTLAFQGGLNDFIRLNYAEQGWDGDAFYDEARLGTTLASIGPVPEPSSMVLLGAGSIAALSVRYRRRALRTG
jgi:hypothetical protein